MNNGTPATERIAVDSVQQRLGDGLEEVLRFLAVSHNRANDGSTVQGATRGATHQVWLPESLRRTVELVGSCSRNREVFGSGDAPNAAESVVDLSQLNKVNTYVSIVEMKGLGLGLAAEALGMPATTGSMKYGPNRFSYSVLDKRWVNVSGVISRSSFMRYMLTRKRSCSFLPR